MSWLWLSLLSAVSLASCDAATKYHIADYTPLELTVIRNIYPALLLAPLLIIQPWPPLSPNFWVACAVAIPLEVVAMSLYSEAICTAPLAHTLPYLGLTPVFISLIGLVMLAERIDATGLAGIACVSVGTYVLNIEQLEEARYRALLAPLRAIVSERGSRLMLLVALVYSITAVVSKAGMQGILPVFFGTCYLVLIGIANMLWLLLKQPRAIRSLWRRPGPNLLVAATMALSTVAHFLALSEVQAAYMIAVKRTSMLFGMVYGAWLFNEHRWRQHLLAGALIVLGVYLIAV